MGKDFVGQETRDGSSIRCYIGMEYDFVNQPMHLSPNLKMSREKISKKMMNHFLFKSLYCQRNSSSCIIL
jgi:hypothetical protein